MYWLLVHFCKSGRLVSSQLPGVIPEWHGMDIRLGGTYRAYIPWVSILSQSEKMDCFVFPTDGLHVGHWSTIQHCLCTTFTGVCTSYRRHS